MIKRNKKGRKERKKERKNERKEHKIALPSQPAYPAGRTQDDPKLTLTPWMQQSFQAYAYMSCI